MLLLVTVEGSRADTELPRYLLVEEPLQYGQAAQRPGISASGTRGTDAASSWRAGFCNFNWYRNWGQVKGEHRGANADDNMRAKPGRLSVPLPLKPDWPSENETEQKPKRHHREVELGLCQKMNDEIHINASPFAASLPFRRSFISPR